jgi:transcriptional regulator with XRE-family HTH domain
MILDKEQIKIGKRLKGIRKKKYMLAKDFADKVGVTPQMVTFWERGQRSIRNKYIPKIVKALNINVSQIFEDEKKQR